MPDGTSRPQRQPIHHYMGTSTFANFMVPRSRWPNQTDAPFEKVCYIGCGVTTIAPSSTRPALRPAPVSSSGWTASASIIQGAHRAP